jgi:hypothetical protein
MSKVHGLMAVRQNSRLEILVQPVIELYLSVCMRVVSHGRCYLILSLLCCLRRIAVAFWTRVIFQAPTRSEATLSDALLQHAFQ